MGLAAVCHLDDAWAVLEQFGKSTSVKWSLQSFSLKVSAQGSWGLQGKGWEGHQTPHCLKEGRTTTVGLRLSLRRGFI